MERLRRLARRADAAYYLAAASNPASVDLHAALGFRELTRDFWAPGMAFENDDGVLFHLPSLADYR